MSLENSVLGLAHIGIRVHNLTRSQTFYQLLGLKLAWGPFGPEKVTAMTHASGLEINLIVNAPDPKSPNVLMYLPEKHAGFTHLALRVSDIASTEAALVAAGVPITGRRGKAPVNAVFVRDPDGNVLELAAD